MAYCVHCGVKLGAGEKRCPLCQTPVYDPAEPERPAAASPKAYPVRTPEQALKRSKRFLLTLAALMLLAPAGLCLVIDLLATGGITWSSYASGALLMLFLSAAPPLAVPRYQVYFAIGAPFLSLNGYLLVRGHRIENAEEARLIQISADAVMIEPLLVAPAVFVGLLLIILIVVALTSRRGMRNEEDRYEEL